MTMSISDLHWPLEVDGARMSNCNSVFHSMAACCAEDVLISSSHDASILRKCSLHHRIAWIIQKHRTRLLHAHLPYFLIEHLLHPCRTMPPEDDDAMREEIDPQPTSLRYPFRMLQRSAHMHLRCHVQLFSSCSNFPSREPVAKQSVGWMFSICERQAGRQTKSGPRRRCSDGCDNPYLTNQSVHNLFDANLGR